MIAGLSYGRSCPSIYDRRRWPDRAPQWNQAALVAMLGLIHPGQFSTLPPSQDEIVAKAILMGLGTSGDFWY